MSEVNAFVMCSAIENHSSTLKEAMSVGVPCVASYVGGVPEYARNKENCLLYRFEDYEHLAMNLISLFRSQELCQKLSVQSRFDMKNSREQNDFYQISKDIYRAILNR
ncbi:glycosyltransferase [Bacteroides faecis]